MTHSRDDSSASNPIGRMNFDCPRSKTEELNKHVQTSKGRDSREKIRILSEFSSQPTREKNRSPSRTDKKPDDDYDEVLRQQSEYLRKNPPSAKFERVEKPVDEPSVEPEQFDDPPENGSVQVLTGIREKLGVSSSKNPLGHPDGFPGAFKLEGRDPRTFV